MWLARGNGGKCILTGSFVGSTSPQTASIQWPGKRQWDQLVIQCFPALSLSKTEKDQLVIQCFHTENPLIGLCIHFLLLTLFSWTLF